MRKQLSTLALGLLSGLAVGQGNVVVQVLSPAPIANSYANAFAVAASGWGVADLTIPENAVLGQLVMAYDGSAADSLACESIVNQAEVAGNIAVIYRGSCTFGQKALNAQEAGALAVLLISNGDDLNINMQGGDFGPQVTIPVAMISQSSGAVIRPVVDVEPVSAFIGNNFGAFPNNLNLDELDIFLPHGLGIPSLVATNASEFQVPLGSFVRNFGNEAQNTARLRVRITQNGNEVYNQVSNDVELQPGDSVFVTLPQFTQSSYTGVYNITYSVESDVTDDFPNDNSLTIPLSFGELISYAPLDPVTLLPSSDGSVIPATFTETFSSCLVYSNPNASRLAVTGLYFTGRTPTDVVAPLDSALTGMLVSTSAFLWSGTLENAFTLPIAGSLATLYNGSYNYDSDRQNEPVFIPFPAAIVLENNERYLFCAETADPLLRHGWSNAVDYQLTSDPDLGVDDQPTTMLRNSVDGWFNGFGNATGTPSLAVRTIAANSIGINELDRVELTPFPNPAQDILRIPMKGFDGAAMLRIFNATGAVVSEQKVAVGGNETMVVDLSNVANGTYMFHVDFENGQRSDFRVVVTK